MSKIQRSLNSLENICKKKLKIDENISVPQIVDFLNKNKIYNTESLFLINFKNKRVKKLKNLMDGTYEILGFKRIYEEYVDTFHIYCRITDGEKVLEYSKYIADKKIARNLEFCNYKKLDLNVRKIMDEKYIFVIRKVKKITKKEQQKRERIIKNLLYDHF